MPCTHPACHTRGQPSQQYRCPRFPHRDPIHSSAFRSPAAGTVRPRFLDCSLPPSSLSRCLTGHLFGSPFLRRKSPLVVPLAPALNPSSVVPEAWTLFTPALRPQAGTLPECPGPQCSQGSGGSNREGRNYVPRAARSELCPQQGSRQGRQRHRFFEAAVFQWHAPRSRAVHSHLEQAFRLALASGRTRLHEVNGCNTLDHPVAGVAVAKSDACLSDDHRLKESTTKAPQNLAVINDDNQASIARNGRISVLPELARTGTAAVKTLAAQALGQRGRETMVHRPVIVEVQANQKSRWSSAR